MPGGYRCSLGHTWAPAAGQAFDTCPICGDTVLIAVEPAQVHGHRAERVLEPEPVMVIEGGRAGSKDATLPPDSPLLSDPSSVDAVPLSDPATPQHRSDPSFSSLVGMPGGADQPGEERAPSAPESSGDVVPFGEFTVDYAPPRVPGYEILNEVGRGGMGVVYKARQLSLNRPVALKMILAGSHAGTIERERFRREAESVASLQHPHIVQIFEIGEADGHLYLALEFVDGGSLAHHLAEGSWPARDAAELVEVLARAVQFAHHHGIVHRDLKPGNILLAGGWPRDRRSRTRPSGESSDGAAIPKITDFGLAKRLGDANNADGTKTGAVMGTPSYIAPEQASGKARDVGPAADVYALGAILYELLTGHPPFTGETPLETVLQVLHDDPVPPKRLEAGVPRDLETICLKCLDKSPAKRYASASALADDLRRFLEGEPIKARPLSAWGRAAKWARRHPSISLLSLVAIASTFALVAVLGMAYARVSAAVADKEEEAKAARQAREKEAEERKRAEALAKENARSKDDAVLRNQELKREAERTRRAAYALQLAQVAAMCERDPHRALSLLENTARCPLDLRDFAWAYLHRLCQREERVYREHPQHDPLHAVAYSPNGIFVATAGELGDIRVWDPRTGRTWAVLTGCVGRVRGLAFSPDGEAIAAAGADHAVRLWELPIEMLDMARRTFKLVPILEQVIRPFALAPAVTLTDAHAGEVNCVAFSPNGRYLVSGGEDGMLRWWDVWGWRPTAADAAAAGVVGSIAAAQTHTSTSLAPRPVWESRPAVEAHAGGVLALSFSASGEVLASGGVDRTARVWAGDGSRLIRTFTDFAKGVAAVAVTPDGGLIAVVNNGEHNGDVPTVRLMSVASGREMRRLIGHTQAIYAVTISPDGELLASAGLNKTIRLWSVEDGLERGLLVGHDQAVNAVAFSPDRRSLISAGSDGTARLWQTAVRPSEVIEASRDLTPQAAAMDAHGGTFVVGDERGRVQVFRTDFFAPPFGPAPFHALFIPIASPEAGPVRSVATGPDGSTVLAATDAAIYVWRQFFPSGRRPGLGSLPLKHPVPLRMPRPVFGMAVSPDGRTVAARDWEGIRLWSLDGVPVLVDPPGTLVDPKGPGLILRMPDVRDLAFDASGKRLAVAVDNGIRVIDRTGKVLVDLPAAHDAKLEAVAFGGKDGEMLATSDERGMVKVWRFADEGRLTLQAELSGHSGPVDALAFSPDGRTLASGGYDRAIVLWDPVTGQERAVLTGHTDRLLAVNFLPDGSALLTIGRDGTARRWRADGGSLTTEPMPLAASQR